ncbi:Ubiquitin [Oopsacas minuta]|uniref:Ubiquitin n=1 Tax=Oopsacas minuta TaxID=111878 RepID=A0AAV7JHX8_9METZ|nr:Ubiquitin [Oopsacas minuta]
MEIDNSNHHNPHFPVLIEFIIYYSSLGQSSSSKRYYLIRSQLTLRSLFSYIEYDLKNIVSSHFNEVSLFCRGHRMNFSSSIHQYLFNSCFMKVHCFVNCCESKALQPESLLRSDYDFLPSNFLQNFSDNVPLFQNFIESHPEINSALSNPDTNELLQQLMTNPSRLNDFMMRHDQELRNIESLPGGYSALERLYKDIQEPLQDVFEDIIPNDYNDVNATQFLSSQHSINAENRRPLRNPWESTNPQGNQLGLGNSSRRQFNYHNSDLTEFSSRMFNDQSQQFSPTRNLHSQGVPNPTLHHPTINSSEILDFDQLEQRFSIQMDILLNMGFTDRNKILKALSLSNGDIDLAVNILLTH